MIVFEGVKKSFGSHTVLDELDLELKKGKINFILGKSGEGKSVTLKHILGLMQPDKGRVLVDDQDVGSLTDHELRVYRRKFGMLFQHAALFDSMTVLENVMFPLNEHHRLSKTMVISKAVDMLQQIGLEGIVNKYPNELSTGEKKRVGLARALVAEPEILLYDEPTTGMDPLVSEMIDQLIVKISRDREQLTSVVISHDLKAALETSDHLVMLYKGKVALAGDADTFKNSSDPVIRQFFSGSVDGPMEFM